jgi:hypothetical protein
MTLRDWTDPRDERRWSVWIRPGGDPTLALVSEPEFHTVVVDFAGGLDDRSDENLQRLLDEGRG